jgi:hypothetical protein
MYCLCQLCCSMYCLCVNVYCTTAIRCQPNCSYKYIISDVILKARGSQSVGVITRGFLNMLVFFKFKLRLRNCSYIWNLSINSLWICFSLCFLFIAEVQELCEMQMILYSENVIYVTECYGEMNISDGAVADCTLSGKFWSKEGIQGICTNLYKWSCIHYT